MEIIYYVIGQLMKAGQIFTLTRDYKVIYQRFLERDSSSGRHRGHVVNELLSEKEREQSKEIFWKYPYRKVASIFL